MGFQGGPLWRGDALYLPAYEPLYGRAEEVLPMAREMIERQPGTDPIVLHTVWECDNDLAALRELCNVIAPCTVPWNAFLDEVDRARAGERGEAGSRQSLATKVRSVGSSRCTSV